MTLSDELRGEASSDQAVLTLLRAADRSSQFVSDIKRALTRSGSELAPDDIEDSLLRLEQSGRLLVREHYCADPHLAGVDLRIAGALKEQAQGEDPVSACIAGIEATWHRWITDYLAEHRCS